MHYSSFIPLNPLFIGLGAIGAVLLLLVIALKGYCLWLAARRNEKWWFIALLIVNTAGILELVYLIFIAKVWPLHRTKNPTV